MTSPTLRELDLLDQLIMTISSQKASSWEQLMILDLNNTVQPEMTFTLKHKQAICGEATCTCALIHSRDGILFQKQENFDPPGSSNKRLSRSGHIVKCDVAIKNILILGKKKHSKPGNEVNYIYSPVSSHSIRKPT